MADTDPVKFDRRSAARIADAVRGYERTETGLTGETARRGRPQVETVFARLTGDDGGSPPAAYDWEQVEIDADGEWAPVAEGRTGTVEERPAYPLAGRAYEADAATGDVVLIRRAPVRQDDDTYLPGWVIVTAGERPGTMFRVNLVQTGGSNGTKTTAASWTYTATDLGGATLGTGLAPERTRENGTRAAATKGEGYYNTAGTFVLAEAWELRGTGACT